MNNNEYIGTINTILINFDVEIVLFITNILDNDDFKTLLYCYSNKLIDNWFIMYYFNNSILRGDKENIKNFINCINEIKYTHENNNVYHRHIELLHNTHLLLPEVSHIFTKVTHNISIFNDICNDKVISKINDTNSYVIIDNIIYTYPTDGIDSKSISITDIVRYIANLEINYQRMNNVERRLFKSNLNDLDNKLVTHKLIRFMDRSGV